MRIALLGFLLVFTAAAARAQPVNVRVSDPSLRDPEEVSIALNPQNLNQLAIGANIRYLFTSTNAGLGWTETEMTSDYGFWGDPCLMYDDSGVLYYEHLSGVGWKDPQFLWRIVVQRSTDAGLTFNGGEQIGFAPPTMQDKAWLGLDRSPTAARGNLYTSWTEFDKYGSHAPLDSSRIFFSLSSDRGLSWSARVRVDDTAGDCLDSSLTVEGATSAVGIDETIFVAWSAQNKIYLDKSTDHGKTFGKERAIADQVGGWDFDVPGINRGNGFAMLASDMNPTSQYYGRLYLLWSDRRSGASDVYCIHSTDNGVSWTAPLHVNASQSIGFFPSMALDPVTGRIYVVYYQRNDLSNLSTNVYLARSIDGAESFSEQQISESVFQPADSVFFGDYIHIVAHNGHVYPVWMREDFDPKPALSVWTAPVVDTTALPLQTVRESPIQQNSIVVYDNGMRPSIALEISASARISVELFDLLGRHIKTLLQGNYGAGSYRIGLTPSIPAGTYIARMTAISQTNNEQNSFSTLATKVVVP